VGPGTGCGTLLHTERCGQPHSRDLDWKIVALDALGLLLFFVPGVIAFVLDFYTGAIYLPPEYPCPPGPGPAMPPGYPPYAEAPSYPLMPAPGPQANFKPVFVPRSELSPGRIEAVVSHHAGRPISLARSQTRLSPLPRLDNFAEQCRRHEADRKFGVGIQTLLSRWQNV
jgi:hypothetical protein